MKPMVAQLVRKFFAFYGTRRNKTMFTTAACGPYHERNETKSITILNILIYYDE
jgi:hypothetical protein